MAPNKLLLLSLCTVPGVIVFIELFLRLPLRKRVRDLMATSGKSLKVVRSPDISDHWKEKAVPRYALRTMALSLSLTFYLIVLFLAFGVVFCVLGLVFFGDLREVLKLTYQTETLIIAVVFGTLYALLRNKLTAPKTQAGTDYTLFSRTLHHIALGSATVKEMAFDLDCLMTRSRSPMTSAPVFIAGLARAGTSILLEAFHSTGAFATLTYRDMPFVTAPYLWSSITSRHRVGGSSKKERAHGDRLHISYDSPEAFEEVFWLTFMHSSYVKDTYLEVQKIDETILDKYKRFVRNVLAGHDGAHSIRYLAKNNNNLMRIDAIKAAFPDSSIVVPFRNPIDHSKSLHIQHQQFLQRHATDPFSLKYMNWLGHFEFGANFKPFRVSPEAVPEDTESPGKLDYWLRYWNSVYAYLMERHASEVLFFDYDKLCETPEVVLGKLESNLSLKEDSLKAFSSSIKCARRHASPEEEQALPEHIKSTYASLRGLSL
jgi:hypothetical protein